MDTQLCLATVIQNYAGIGGKPTTENQTLTENYLILKKTHEKTSHY